MVHQLLIDHNLGGGGRKGGEGEERGRGGFGGERVFKCKKAIVFKLHMGRLQKLIFCLFTVLALVGSRWEIVKLNFIFFFNNI